MTNLFLSSETDALTAQLESLARTAVQSLRFDVTRIDPLLGAWVNLDAALRAVTSLEGHYLEHASRTILADAPNFKVFEAGLEMGRSPSNQSLQSPRYKPDLVALNRATGTLVIAEFKRNCSNHGTRLLNEYHDKLERAAQNATAILKSDAACISRIKLAIVDCDGLDGRASTLNLEQFETVLSMPGFAQTLNGFRTSLGSLTQPLLAELVSTLQGTQASLQPDLVGNKHRREIDAGIHIEFCHAPRKSIGGRL